jgi:hypothetical protein
MNQNPDTHRRQLRIITALLTQHIVISHGEDMVYDGVTYYSLKFSSGRGNLVESLQQLEAARPPDIQWREWLIEVMNSILSSYFFHQEGSVWYILCPKSRARGNPLTEATYFRCIV